MQTPQVHCNIDETSFSATIFLTRLLAAVALVYVSMGCLLYYKDFLVNAAALSVPVGLALSAVVLQLVLALLLILGWFTRVAAGACVLCTGFCGFVFFASNFNKVYIALIILLIASLLPAALLGPGRLSLDFIHAKKRVEKQFRG